MEDIRADLDKSRDIGESRYDQVNLRIPEPEL
jgi:hypothetical protein